MKTIKKTNYFLETILHWYAVHGVDFPWRKTRDPYRIWVSEIMLQQTQAPRVVAYYERFLAAFPTIQDLAQTTWEELLPYWRGLGFYGRGKRMIEAAKVIVQGHSGQFPQDEKELQSLPGVGPYTAAAILSFAFQQATPALDTNVHRVMTRFFACTEKSVQARMAFLLEQLDDPGLLHHALMDLGREICSAKKPKCAECPMKQECFLAHKIPLDPLSSPSQKTKNPPNPLPKRGRKKNPLHPPCKGDKKRKPFLDVAAACIHRNGKYLVAQRSEEKGGQWEFVGGKREMGEDWRHALKREVMEEIGVEVSVRPHFFEKMWEESDVIWRLRFFRCQILQGEPKKTEHQNLQWIPGSRLNQVGMLETNREAIQKLQKMR